MLVSSVAEDSHEELSEFARGCVLTSLVAAFLSVMGGIGLKGCGKDEGVSEVRRDAAKAGAGGYVMDREDGSAVWRWTTAEGRVE